MPNFRSLRSHAVWILLLLLILLPACVAAVAANRSSEPLVWLKPAQQDANGRYTNPVGNLLSDTGGVRLPFMWGRLKNSIRPRKGRLERVESGALYFRNGGFAKDERARGAANPEAGSEEAVQDIREDAGTGATVTWIGHATVLVEMDGVRFLTDPIWSKRASPISWMGPARTIAPGITFDALPEIDFVLVSHSHFDHLDIPTLECLAKRNAETTFLVPLGNAELLRRRGIERVKELDWTEQVRLGGVVIHCLPAQHWSKRSLTDTDKALWSSWAVIGDERRFYFAGDTGYFSGFSEIGEALGPFDLAAIPIGAYEPTQLMRLTHLDPEQAVQAALDVRARRAMAIHFGTFDLADEPLDEPPKRFLAAARQETLETPPAVPFEPWVLSIGEIRPF